MTRTEAMEIIQTERSCVLMASTCDRDCGRCELVRKTADIIEAFDVAIDALMEAPRARGTWIKKRGTGIYYCSECGLPSLHDWPYCERCGADMRGLNDEVN